MMTAIFPMTILYQMMNTNRFQKELKLQQQGIASDEVQNDHFQDALNQYNNESDFASDNNDNTTQKINTCRAGTKISLLVTSQTVIVLS